MTKEDPGAKFRTIIVTGCEAMVTHDGRAGLHLVTVDEINRNEVSLVLDLSLQAIDGLRKALAAAEQHLSWKQKRH